MHASPPPPLVFKFQYVIVFYSASTSSMHCTKISHLFHGQKLSVFAVGTHCTVRSLCVCQTVRFLLTFLPFSSTESGSFQSSMADGSYAEIGEEAQTTRTSSSSPDQRSHLIQSHIHCCDEHRTSCPIGLKERRKKEKKRELNLAALQFWVENM